MTTIHPVILCGGSGTRLWPRSRKSRPKPFLPLLGETTLFQQSLARLSDASLFAPPTIVAGAAHVGFIEEQVGENNEGSLVIEPTARNTAPAIALAAALLPPDATMLVCPSDHFIGDNEAFLEGVRRAARLAEEDWMVAFGIEPTAPETGYGYIRRGGELDGGHRIDRFVEKPDLDTALRFLESGEFVWNGGIFAFRAGAYLSELRRYRPAMADAVAASVETARREGWRIHPASGPFASIKGESIDYAVMENTDRAAVVSANMGWSDIGNWDAVLNARGGDGAGNCVAGPADLIDCRNVLVESDGPRVSVAGLEDVIVVVDGDEVLVAARAAAQDIGKLPGASNQ